MRQHTLFNAIGLVTMQAGTTDLSNEREPIMVRGCVTVALDPIMIRWRDIFVPLSKVEAEVYAHVFRRGRIQVAEIDELLERIGASRATRSLVLGHIRSKFMQLGACNPFERLGNDMLRLQVDADANGRSAPLIGQTACRYARIDPT
ncbi:MAG: hypothetical protein EOO77_09420 [Oxalobacteraceae bacterium]|nr:MAG: hypothetical protein EOO77_09420 [Oxalobacteraceae bacterium]